MVIRVLRSLSFPTALASGGTRAVECGYSVHGSDWEAAGAEAVVVEGVVAGEQQGRGRDSTGLRVSLLMAQTR